MIDFLINYWVHILIGVLFMTGVVFFIFRQKKNIKEWLLYACIEAEKGLGSKTGKIKLRQVYDWFIQAFPVISKLIAFNTFSKLVDLALVEMKEILSTNAHCKEYVEGAEINEC